MTMKSSLLGLVIAMILSACGGGGSGNSGTKQATLQRIEITAPKDTVEAGRNLELSATGFFSDGSSQIISGNYFPSPTKPILSLNWSTSSSSTAVIAGNTLITKAQGTVTVVVTDDFSKVSGSKTFTVTAAVPSAIRIIGFESGKNSYSLRESRQLTGQLVFTDGVVTNSSLTWQSSNPNIFVVDSNGNFSAKGAGTATLTASNGQLSSTKEITIVNPVTAKFTVSCNPSTPTVIKASEWNAAYAVDVYNSTEWIVVDGTSCSTKEVVMLLVPKGNSSLFTTIFTAKRNPNKPSEFLSGATYSTGLTPQLSIGQKINVGEQPLSESLSFTTIYQITTQ
jgi:hypothetical protein